jgi:hypothetical protein
LGWGVYAAVRWGFGVGVDSMTGLRVATAGAVADARSTQPLTSVV